MKKPTFAFTSVNVFFLSSPGVLKPHLGDSLAEPCHRGYSFEILTVGIAIYLKVCLQHLKLFLRESRSNPLGFVLVITVAFATVCKMRTFRKWIFNDATLTCHRSMSFHRRRSPCSAIYIKPYRPTKQIVHLSRAAGRIGRRQSRQDEKRALWPVSPSPMLRFHGNISNILLRNSWKSTWIMKITFDQIIFNENVLSWRLRGLCEPWNRKAAKDSNSI